MRAIVISAAIGGVVFAALLWRAPASAQVRQFDVPSGIAEKSVTEFARQAGIQVLAPGDQLHGVVTPAVKGTYDVFAALNLMLKGTDLKVGRSAEGIVTISLPKNKKAEEREDMSPELKSSTSIFALV